MEGVILFADDHIFDTSRDEHKLFQKFNSDGSYSILPINNLATLEKTIASISTYKAIIFDWNFKRPKEDNDEEIEGVQIPDENPHEFLKTQKLYSLVYVYSQNDIEENIKLELQALYPNKIFFEKKESTNQPDKEYKKITEGIKKFEYDNKHLIVPFVWSQAINQSAQAIFTELEQADPNWIKDIYKTAKEDETEPNVEVIGVFQNLLSESVIQNEALLKSLSEFIQSEDINIQDKESSLAKLYNRIYYTKLIKDAPLMTGDIFKFSEVDYAILFTAECDINAKKDTVLEFLTFKKNDFDYYLETKREYKKSNFKDIKLKGFKNDSPGNSATEIKGKLKELITDFNNGNLRTHILPSFPFEPNMYNYSAFIDFETAFLVKSKADFDSKRAEYKLNSPYIFQLRQRFLAYIGRVGVPAIPRSLKLYNLKES